MPASRCPYRVKPVRRRGPGLSASKVPVGQSGRYEDAAPARQSGVAASGGLIGLVPVVSMKETTRKELAKTKYVIRVSSLSSNNGNGAVLAAANTNTVARKSTGDDRNRNDQRKQIQ